MRRFKEEGAEAPSSLSLTEQRRLSNLHDLVTGMMTSMREPESAHQRGALTNEDRPATLTMPIRHICQFRHFHSYYRDEDKPRIKREDAIRVLGQLAKQGCLDWADEQTSTRSLFNFVGNWIYDSSEWKMGANGKLYAVILNDNRPKVDTFEDYDAGYFRIGFAWKTPIWPIISNLLCKASWVGLCRPAFALDADVLSESEMNEMDLEEAIKMGKEDIAEEVRLEIQQRDSEDWRQPWYKEACSSFFQTRHLRMDKLVDRFRSESALAEDLEPFLAEALQLASEVDDYGRITKRMFTREDYRNLHNVDDESSIDGYMFPIHWGNNDHRLSEYIDQVQNESYNNFGSVIAYAKRWIDAKGRVFEKTDLDLYPIKQHLRLRICSWNERLYDHLHPRK